MAAVLAGRGGRNITRLSDKKVSSKWSADSWGPMRIFNLQLRLLNLSISVRWGKYFCYWLESWFRNKSTFLPWQVVLSGSERTRAAQGPRCRWRPLMCTEPDTEPT